MFMWQGWLHWRNVNFQSVHFRHVNVVSCLLCASFSSCFISLIIIFQQFLILSFWLLQHLIWAHLPFPSSLVSLGQERGNKSSSFPSHDVLNFSKEIISFIIIIIIITYYHHYFNDDCVTSTNIFNPKLLHAQKVTTKQNNFKSE